MPGGLAPSAWGRSELFIMLEGRPVAMFVSPAAFVLSTPKNGLKSGLYEPLNNMNYCFFKPFSR